MLLQKYSAGMISAVNLAMLEIFKKVSALGESGNKELVYQDLAQMVDVPVIVEIEGECEADHRVDRFVGIRGKEMMEDSIRFKTDTHLNVGDIQSLIEKMLWKERGMAGLQGTSDSKISEKHIFWLSSFHDGKKFLQTKLFDHDKDLSR